MLLKDVCASCKKWLKFFCHQLLWWEFTHFFHRIFGTEKQNPQTFLLFGCMISPPSPPPCYLSWWQGGGVELAEGSPSSWSCWFHGASLIWHLHAVAGRQRVIDNSKDIHLELSMTRLTSDPLFKRNIIYLIIITIMMHWIIITIMMHWIIITIMTIPRIFIWSCQWHG